MFPGTSLPLNIFENRYIEMINYSLSKNRCIGMIQSDKNNNLYEIGCVGKIHSFNETNDGRYLISLQGTSCFKVIEELKQSYSFRLINADLIVHKENDGMLSESQKVFLLKKYAEFIKLKKINLNLEDIEKVELGQIIKFIAMTSPFNNVDKQALLETKDTIEFYTKLLSVIELELVGEFKSSSIN